MKIIKFFTILFLLSGFLSCGKSELAPKEYIEWCDNTDNQLIKEFEQGDITLTCQYLSSEYAVLKQSDPNDLDKLQVQENIEAVSDLVEFKLKFQNKKSNNFLKDNYTTAEEFNVRSLYLSYGMRSDLKLVSESDTSGCVLLHHERTYGNTPYETVLLTFPRKKKDEADLELIFNDRVFGLGRVKFFYEKDDIMSIPKLDLEGV